MFKFVKGLALLIPTIIGVVLLAIVLQKLPEVNTNMELMELKMNSLVGIIGVAVSVWIGLNIYNVVEKEEVAKMAEKIKHLESLIEESEIKIASMNEKIEQTEERINRGVKAVFG